MAYPFKSGKVKENLNSARDLFLFSFMACGIAFVDGPSTRANIHGNVLVYYRMKTKRKLCYNNFRACTSFVGQICRCRIKFVVSVLKSPDAAALRKL